MINSHATVNPSGKPLRVILTSGQIDDIYQAEALTRDRPVNFVGARILCGMLTRDGIQIGRKYAGTRMGKIENAAISRKSNTSAPQPKHPIALYLRKNPPIDWPNQVRATELIFFAITSELLYLVAIPDWASRKLLARWY